MRKRVIASLAAASSMTTGTIATGRFMALKRGSRGRRDLVRTRPFIGDFDGRHRTVTAPLFDGTLDNARLLQQEEGNSNTYPPMGDSICPCLTEERLPPANYSDLSLEDQIRIGSSDQFNSYGYGCATHDANTTLCQGDPREWCNRAWCWVDPSDCVLLHNLGPKRPQLVRAYSYATCRQADYFTQSTRIERLENRLIRLGFVTNSGGWKGAYHDDGFSFDGPLDKWRGPMVDFIKDAAQYAKFEIQVVTPPDFLQNRSIEYWNDTGRFNFCVYATALGFLDACVAQLTITETRAGAVDWIVMDESPLQLIAQANIPTEVVDYQSAQKKIMESFSVILEPFKTSTWYFLILVVMPILGMLMIVHEYGQPGSKFQVNEKQMRQEPDGSVRVEIVRIPMYRHTFTAIHAAVLGVLQWSYPHGVTTLGARIHLLGISFMILGIISVYTANLAAILRKPPAVGSFEETINKGYRFCAERQEMKVVMGNYGLPEHRFAIDPDNGKRGFLAKRNMVYDRLSFDFAEQDETYCHVAISFLQDLELLQNKGLHCNKTVVDVLRIGVTETGFPLFEGNSASLKSLFTQLKNEGVLSRYFLRDQPRSTCRNQKKETDLVDQAFSIQELSGIWTISFSIALLGWAISYLQPWKPIKMKQKRKTRKRLLMLEEMQNGKRLRRNSKDYFVPPVWQTGPPHFDKEEEKNQEGGDTYKDQSETNVEVTRWLTKHQ